MFCAKCGKEIKDDANFCTYCGMAFGKEQAPTSSRGVATKCSVCGKELSSSEVRFASSTSFKPCCAGCVGKTVSETGTPQKTYEFSRSNAETEAGADHRLREAARVAAVASAKDGSGLKAAEGFLAAARVAAVASNDEQGRKAFEEYLLAGRKFWDGVTGEATSAEPMPDLMTEAGLAELGKEVKDIMQLLKLCTEENVKEAKRLKEMRGRQLY